MKAISTPIDILIVTSLYVMDYYYWEYSLIYLFGQIGKIFTETSQYQTTSTSFLWVCDHLDLSSSEVRKAARTGSGRRR